MHTVCTHKEQGSRVIMCDPFIFEGGSGGTARTETTHLDLSADETQLAKRSDQKEASNIALTG